MAVRIRLSRTGRTKLPTYRVVVADARSPRDGKFIDILGRYDPRPDPSIVEIDNDKAVGWLVKGAQPSDAVRKLLEISGALQQFETIKGESKGESVSSSKAKPAKSTKSGESTKGAKATTRARSQQASKGSVKSTKA